MKPKEPFSEQFLLWWRCHISIEKTVKMLLLVQPRARLRDFSRFVIVACVNHSNFHEAQSRATFSIVVGLKRRKKSSIQFRFQYQFRGRNVEFTGLNQKKGRANRFVAGFEVDWKLAISGILAFRKWFSGIQFLFLLYFCFISLKTILCSRMIWLMKINSFIAIPADFDAYLSIFAKNSFIKTCNQKFSMHIISDQTCWSTKNRLSSCVWSFEFYQC